MAGNQGYTVWITGLPRSGKTRLAEALAALIERKGQPVEIIHSSRIRKSPLGSHLGFSRDDRDTNVRRHAFTARLLAKNGVAAIVSAVSPYKTTRQEIKGELDDFVLVHVSTPRAACIERDTTGVWDKALKGEIRHFTGVDDPYEPPERPDVEVDLAEVPVEQAVWRVAEVLMTLGYLPDATMDLGTEDAALLGALD